MPEFETCSTRDRGYMGEQSRGASMGRPARSAADIAAHCRSNIALHERIRADWTGEGIAADSPDLARLDSELARNRATLADAERAMADSAPRFQLRRVRLNSGGYDSGGAYWGHGGALYEAFTADGSEFMTLRVYRADRAAAFERRGGAAALEACRAARPGPAPSREFKALWNWSANGDRETAKDLVRAEYPGARFYR